VTTLSAAACRCDGVTPTTCIDDDEWLTQFTKIGSAYRSEPRLASMMRGRFPAQELDVSLVRDRLEGWEAYEIAVGRVLDSGRRAEWSARHVQAGALRRSGFTVIHTPGPIAGHPHVSVVWAPDGNAVVNPQVPWDLGVSESWGAWVGGWGAEA
jgi:hypothetical protein